MGEVAPFHSEENNRSFSLPIHAVLYDGGTKTCVLMPGVAACLDYLLPMHQIAEYSHGPPYASMLRRWCLHRSGFHRPFMIGVQIFS